MEKLIKYLVYTLNTVDGKKNSALKIIETLNDQSLYTFQE